MPGCDAIGLTDARYRELLRIRRSSPVFGLPTAAEVGKRLSFPLAGAGETPGVITMRLDGRGLDPRWSSVPWSSTPPRRTVSQTVPALRGQDVALHPVLRDSADPVVRSASADPGPVS